MTTSRETRASIRADSAHILLLERLQTLSETMAEREELDYHALNALLNLWDDNGNIGKRYRRQDEIGTPHCVVIDFQTLEDNTVTVRERDTTEQRRVNVEEL